MTLVQRSLHSWIDRWFFPERYALQQGVGNLFLELPACTESQAVLTLVGERLNTTLRPESCVIYRQVGEAYSPVFVQGSTIPPTLQARGPLAGAFQAWAATDDLEQWRRTAREYLGPADRATLDSLRLAVVLPVSQDDAPAAFVCLGQKRSGDIYTATDLSLLAAVAEKMSCELRRCETTPAG